MKQVQDFYKATITQDWSIGIGNFYVSVKPTITEGWLYVSPNNTSLREQIYYNGTGTDANGDYITITERGLGETNEQTHTIGEPIRMNIGECYIEYLTDAIDDIVAGAAPNADTSTKGLVEIATDAEVIAGTDIGGTGAKLVATPSQIKDNYEKIVPIVRTYTASTQNNYGSSTTRFDITKTGNTVRYTWDGTGTDPTINTTTFPVGIVVNIYSASFYRNNNLFNSGSFVVINSGTNWFEVTNPNGVAEVDKTLNADGGLQTISPQTWTKPAGLKYIEVEVQGGGGSGSFSGSSGSEVYSGGGGGGWAYKKYNASELNSIENLYVASDRTLRGANDNNGGRAFLSKFKNVIALGGWDGCSDTSKIGWYGLGGDATGGDINAQGQTAGPIGTGGGFGGGSRYGAGGRPTGTTGEDGFGYGSGGSGGKYNSFAKYGGYGKGGLIIIKEYY